MHRWGRNTKVTKNEASEQAPMAGDGRGPTSAIPAQEEEETYQESTSKTLREKIHTELKKYILKINPELEKTGQVYSSTVNETKKVTVYGADGSKSDKINMLRHMATTILASNSEFVEVQLGIQGNKIFIASNKGDDKLPKGESDIRRLLESVVLNATPRIERHRDKLTKRLKQKQTMRSKYEYEIVHGLRGEHAEIKLIKNNKYLDTITGVNRPCLACTIYMRMAGIQTTVYNNHVGAYWDSQNALMPIIKDYLEEDTMSALRIVKPTISKVDRLIQLVIKMMIGKHAEINTTSRTAVSSAPLHEDMPELVGCETSIMVNTNSTMGQ